jgi:phycocyanobilin:ferredoxin oxidoreductase
MAAARPRPRPQPPAPRHTRAAAATPTSSTPPWRLAADLPPPLALVADRIEAAWTADVRGVARLPLRSDWEWADSGNKSDGGGGGGASRLRIENRAYASPAFRKLHLEAAVRDDGLAVLHCVLYPRLALGGGGFPILSLDAVAVGDAVSLTIVDPCPARLDGRLPPAYDAAAAGVASSTGLPPANRAAPEWGKTIFSRHCALTRPADSQAYLQWAAYALTLHDAHLRLADEALTVGGAWAWGGEGGGGDAALADTAAAHARYAACQLANAKTRRVLEVAFGAGWAGEYMEGCMFDVEEGG